MKLNEVKEVGFYCEVNDIDRKVIYEVIENTDEDWLKEDPEATLLIDTWHYEYKDENDRDRYSVDGNLLTLYLDESDIDVVKIEDTKYKVFGEMGQFLIEDKPTYKEQLQLKTAECEELKKEKAEIKKYLGINHKSILERLEELQEKRDELSEKNIFYEQALNRIKEIVKINCEEICGRKFEDCNDFLCPSKNIIDIISKAKGQKNGYRK